MSTLSRIRAWLGCENLPASRDGRYRLAVTDWAALQASVCTPAGDSGRDVRTTSCGPRLSSVQGEPLADLDAVWADGVRLQVSLLVADVALELATRTLRRGQIRQANLAVGHGLLAFPGHPELLELAAASRVVVAGAA